MSEVRTWLKSIRKQKRLTLKQAAEKAGIPESTYKGIEQGRTPRREETAQKIADALGFDISRFGGLQRKRRDPLSLKAEEDEKQIYEKLTRRYKKQNTGNILTVKKDGTVTGDYWKWMKQRRVL